ncbi:MAG: DUF4375 domain-containing protein [Candidatus Saccharibacteria bacterium]
MSIKSIILFIVTTALLILDHLYRPDMPVWLDGIFNMFMFAGIFFALILLIIIAFNWPQKISKERRLQNQYFAKIITNKKSATKKDLNNQFFIIENIKYVDKEQVDEEFIEEMLKNVSGASLIISPFLSDMDEDGNQEIYKNSDNMHTYLTNRLTKEQMNIYLIDQYQAEVNNGGHEQWLFNSSGLTWKDTLQALKNMKLEKSYDILDEYLKKALRGTHPSTAEDIKVLAGDDLPPEGTLFRSGDVFNKLSDLRYLDSKFQKINIDQNIKKFIKNNISKFIYK